jgi:hypothetical protein
LSTATQNVALVQEIDVSVAPQEPVHDDRGGFLSTRTGFDHVTSALAEDGDAAVVTVGALAAEPPPPDPQAAAQSTRMTEAKNTGNRFTKSSPGAQGTAAALSGWHNTLEAQLSPPEPGRAVRCRYRAVINRAGDFHRGRPSAR